MKMINPKISVVTVCYNAKDTIEKTILSVINQTYDNVEYIIVDGASTDGTVDIIKKYGNCIARWVSEPDSGIYDAMNKGLRCATGDYLNFMNAGDTFYDNDVICEVARNVGHDIDVIFGDVAFVIDNLLYVNRAVPFYNHLPLHHSMGFNHQSTFVRTQLAKKLEFDLRYELAADYNMIISIYRLNGVFKQLHGTIVAIYDITGVSAKKRRLHYYEKLMVDNPSCFFNALKSYIFALKNMLVVLVKHLVNIVYPDYILKRRQFYFEQLKSIR